MPDDQYEESHRYYDKTDIRADIGPQRDIVRNLIYITL
ncbi:hypothetical protein BVIR_1357 [Blastochloris viridis]|uniref:Uncharacterized protein n=1 Tax=Blastochloris viridis TaxID=1079 RepID=A0A0H5BFK3_BLAVI|nr:hypothetical protein BVIR_1357 [Blastochloris viridis]BAS00991.1 hypothetical protein BV133_3397 [Blastochloris viridis]CUU41806.1 hypothetical protein BVIRIDIS_08020 [Blastochloris viridis]